MKLSEHYGKRLLSKYGVPVPDGWVASNQEEVHEIAERLGKKVVVKAQVLAGGRGKAGGIKVAEDAARAEQAAKEMLGMEISGRLKSEKLINVSPSLFFKIVKGSIKAMNSAAIISFTNSLIWNTNSVIFQQSIVP